jgi:hypothetical protein
VAEVKLFDEVTLGFFTRQMTADEWRALAAEFRKLDAECGDTPMRAERKNSDGTIDVIPNVCLASALMCEEKAAAADAASC